MLSGVFHRTTPSFRMVSTVGGMRRILKKQPPLHQYIRQALEAGIYKSPTPFDGGSEELKDYPLDYHILSMNPPLPRPTRISRRDRKRIAAEARKNNDGKRKTLVLPTDELVRAYLRRVKEEKLYEFQHHEAHQARYGQDTTSFMHESSSTGSIMRRKARILDKAYDFALRQLDVMNTAQNDMTAEQSRQLVEELLAKEQQKERFESRKATEQVQQWRKEEAHLREQREEERLEEEGTEQDDDFFSDSEPDQPPSGSIPSLFFGRPRTIKAMTIWSKRLQAVPYHLWTVGAATALDHWIAVDVLGLSEDTWNTLLDGGDLLGTDAHEDSYTGRARDVVTVRSALFPETFGGYEEFEPTEEEADIGVLDEESQENLASIDELLASLSGLDADEPPTTQEVEEDMGNAGEDRIAYMTASMQEWRKKHREVPYEQWDEATAQKFDRWLDDFIRVMQEDGDGDVDEKVDMDATREMVLNGPIMSAEESANFWNNIRDETQVEIFLQSLHSDPGSPESEAHAEFLKLPYEVQLRKLVDMGSLRPLLDEYINEADRRLFMSRHAEKLMEGMMVEHLVPDPLGPIRERELGRNFFDDEADKADRDEANTPPNNIEQRYRVELIPYGTDDYGTTQSLRARELFLLWNEQKAGRARYEEALFQRGMLPLQYEEPLPEPRLNRRERRRQKHRRSARLAGKP